MMAASLDNRFPLSFYYRIADNIVKEAQAHREEGDMEGFCQALSRYTKIISDVIPHHRSYSVHSNEMIHHQKILHEFIKELESINSQFGINNDGISRLSTGWYKQRGSVSYISHNGNKDVSLGLPGEKRISRTKSSTSAHGKDAKMVYATATDTNSCTMLQSSSTIAEDVDMNVHAVKHYLPSCVLSCVEAPPVIGQVSHVTFSEPNNLYVESSCEESSSSKAIKDVHISAGLMEEFMVLAKANTEKDLETCGILGASLKNHVYYITALIMPKQESTSNSCQALNEEEIHAILDGEALYPAGWIHTHPSQTCFLSSIDLHTQYSYQVMLPEAVAIVMAPSDTERKSGIFRISDPGGINVLRQCLERGFHPHQETADGSPIYENCSNVYINPNLRFEIFDMRLQCSD